jgi:hypothetical protein
MVEMRGAAHGVMVVVGQLMLQLSNKSKQTQIVCKMSGAWGV